MSGTRQIWNAGAAIVDEDLQRAADAAARADDLAIAALISPNDTPTTALINPMRLIMPSARLGVGGTPIIPEQILVPGTGGAAGKLKLFPVTFLAYDVAAGAIDTIDNQGVIELSVRMLDAMLTALLPSNASGGVTTYFVYATISRAVDVVGARKVKNLVDGSDTTQTVNLADDPAVTLTVLGAGSTIASMPADSATAWNIALAEIDIPNPFTAGVTPITQSMIRQLWRRAGIGPHAQHRVMTSTPAGVGVLVYSTPYVAGAKHLRHTSKTTKRFLVHINGDTGAGPHSVLDDTIDYRQRIARLSILRGPDEGGGTYKSVDTAIESGSTLAEDSRLCLIGGGGTPSGAICAFDSNHFMFYVGNGTTALPTLGALYMQIAVGFVPGNYVIEIEYSDRMDE